MSEPSRNYGDRKAGLLGQVCRQIILPIAVSALAILVTMVTLLLWWRESCHRRPVSLPNSSSNLGAVSRDEELCAGFCPAHEYRSPQDSLSSIWPSQPISAPTVSTREEGILIITPFASKTFHKVMPAQEDSGIWCLLGYQQQLCQCWASSTSTNWDCLQVPCTSLNALRSSVSQRRSLSESRS